MSELRTIDDVACTMCGCVCDDLSVSVDGDQVVAADNACCISRPWFLAQEQSSKEQTSASVDGSTVPLEEALKASVELLKKSSAPLIYGLSRSSTSGQRAAVRLADSLGASIDTTASTCHAPSIMALQHAGESTCSLGEIRNRSKLVVYWGSNPLKSHPRHVEQYVDSAGMFVDGRKSRHLVVVDTESTETSEIADTFIKVQPGRDFELISALRMYVSGEHSPTDRPSDIAGLTQQQVHEFARLLTSYDYGAVFFGLGITRSSVPHATVEALLRLTTDLNAHTRFVVRRMRVPGDVAGADSVLCWQTGFPFSVNLARGYPRYNPGEYTAENLLTRGEVDAAVLVGGEGVSKLSLQAQSHLASIPTILLDYPNTEHDFVPKIRFTTAVYGLHRPGTAYRMDEIPIPLKGFIESKLPSDDEVLSEINAGIRDQ